MLIDRHAREGHLREFELFLEEMCCGLCRSLHAQRDGLHYEQIRIDREVYLGSPGAFADIRVQVPSRPGYFVEIKYGAPPHKILSHLIRKYGKQAAPLRNAEKVILVVDSNGHPDWPQFQREMEGSLCAGLRLEVWDESRLLSLLREAYQVEIGCISPDKIGDLKQALDTSRGCYAFGERWRNDSLQSSLLWHFSSWRLKQLLETRGNQEEAILPPGLYKGVVVLMADLCSFSSYVKDTKEDEVVRLALTSFYARSGYQIRNSGGMIYQFVGDEVVGLYGIGDHDFRYLQAALQTAEALLDIGNSVSHQWQRRIDLVQKSGGVHIGMALGDIQIVPLRPFGRAHFGAVSDALNLAARLLGNAGPSEIVVSNAYYQRLEQDSQARFVEMEPLEVRNLGRVGAWKLCQVK